MMQKGKFRERIKKITDPILTQGPTTAKIRVRLDSRTIITIHEMAALAVWLLRYPDAKVIS